MPKLTEKLSLSHAIVEIGIFSTIINLLLLVMPLYMLQVYDRVIPSSSENTLFYISVIAVFALLILGILEAVRALYANRLAARLDVKLGPRLFAVAMNSPRAAIGDVQPLRDLATIRSFIGSRVIFFLFDLPYGPVFIVLLYFVHPVLFLIAVAGALVMIALAVLNQKMARASGKEAAKSLSAALNTAQAFARNAESVRTLGMMSGAVSHWGAQFQRSLEASDRSVTINAKFGSISRGVRLLLQIAMYGVGAYLTLEGQMTAGMIFAASMVSARALQPLDQIVGSWNQISETYAAWKRISGSLRTLERSGWERTDLPAPNGDVSAENLVYVLPDAQKGELPLIKGVNFTIAPGTTLAVIGPSQAGKSTLARLIVGAIEPTSGFVRLDGADLKTWDREKLGAHIGYLSQEAELFPGTIAQNIARFDPSATSEEIVAAAKRAEVHQLILGQPDGYDTMIGPLGVRLSGGERQRIGLARAFYRDPKLVVLDEPNANLDTEGEAALAEVVRQAKARLTTVIVVTHRPSLAAECDSVLMLRAGQIEHFGPSTEVLRRFGCDLPPAQRRAEIVPVPTGRMVPGASNQIAAGERRTGS